MKWKIVTDSGANIRFDNKISDTIGFQLVPLLINIGTQLFIDDSLDKVEELMDTMEASKLGSSSACPSPDAYAKTFMDADNVICFTLSSNLSGSYNSAILARDLVLENYPEKNIYIFDSLAAGSEMDLLIIKALELVKQDLSFNQVIEELNTYHQTTNIIFMLESVDNLVKNGRLNKLVGGMIGLLGIRLVANRSETGTIEIIHKSKGTKRALKTMFDELLSRGYQGGRLVLSYVLNEDNANDFKTLVLNQFPNAEITILPTSGLCSYYAQRGGLLVGFTSQP